MPYIYWPYDQINESIIKDMQILFFCTIPMERIFGHGLSEVPKIIYHKYDHRFF